MKQIWITRKGPPEVLQVKEGPDLVPGPNQVLLSVKAAGVNFSDLLARRGRYPEAPNPPMVVGYEVSGEVLGLGQGVTEFSLGQKVFAPVYFGGYSSQCLVSKEQVFPIPAGMSFSQAAAFPINYLTAFAVAHEIGRIRTGDRVLIYSAAGGVGLALIDLCRVCGAVPVGVASASKHSALKKRGVETLIDSKSATLDEDILKASQPKGFDLIFDSRGGESWSSSLKLLAPFGKLIAFGFSSCLDEITTGVPAFKPEGTHIWFGADLFQLAQSNVSVAGFNLATLWKKSFSEIRKWTLELLKYQEQGKLNITVDKEFRFEEAAEAHRYLEDRKNFGKVVLLPS